MINLNFFWVMYLGYVISVLLSNYSEKKSVLNCDIQYSFYFSLFLSKLGIEFVLSSVMMLIYCNLVKYLPGLSLREAKSYFLQVLTSVT